MRYTRIDLRRNNKELRIMIILIFIFIFAFSFGTMIFNLFFKNDVKASVKPSETVSAEKNVYKFSIIQCGVFAVKSNADITMANVSKIGNPFIKEDMNKFKVIFGIYENGKEVDAINLLSKNNIVASKINLNCKVENNYEEQIVEISKAMLNVNAKFLEQDVSSVNITDMKEWIKTFENLGGEKKYETLISVKEYVSKLPDKVTRDKISEIQMVIYNAITSLTVNS